MQLPLEKLVTIKVFLEKFIDLCRGMELIRSDKPSYEYFYGRVPTLNFFNPVYFASKHATSIRIWAENTLEAVNSDIEKI